MPHADDPPGHSVGELPPAISGEIRIILLRSAAMSQHNLQPPAFAFENVHRQCDADGLFEVPGWVTHRHENGKK